MLGALALVGSGEYLPSMLPLEAELFSAGLANGKSPKFVQLATAAGQESYASLNRWRELGEVQAKRMGAEPVFVEAFDRAATDKSEVAEKIDNAALIYLSGGDPGYLARTLKDSRLYSSIIDNWSSGSSLAGCSAGAMALAAEIPNPFKLSSPATPGLGLIPNLKVLPHFDRYFGWVPKPMANYLAKSKLNILTVGIDENTALVSAGELNNWSVWGYGKVKILNRHERELISGDNLDIQSELLTN